MRLLFMRHAKAVEREGWKGEENLRPLSPEGERDTSRAAKRLSDIGFHVEAILTSPLARAVRTAEIVASALKPGSVPEIDERLSPGFDEDALDEILDEREGIESILFVGHEPDFGLVIGSLVSCARIELKSGALALVESDNNEDGTAYLAWLIPQKYLI